MDQFQIIGAIKIKDGLFMGDEYSAQDLDFMVTNKINHIINCAGKQIPNIWESIGISYLTFPWLETDSQIIFDERDENLNEIFNFLETARLKGEGCLVHSLRGLSRSCCVLAGYFMRKFRWTLYKTLEFLHSRRPDLEIRASFFSQMNKLETRITSKGGILYNSWDDLNEDQVLREEELIIRNTFLNSKQNKPSIDEFMGLGIKKYMNKGYQKRMNLNWVDEVFRDKSRLTTEIKQKPLNNYKTSKVKKTILKSILKPSGSDLGTTLTNNNNTSLNMNKNPLKSLNNFNIYDANQTINKSRLTRPSTPNPEHETFTNKSLKDMENPIINKPKLTRPSTPNPEHDNLTNKTLNNLKEIENSKSLINQLINKNPLLMRKKVNNFLEDHSNKPQTGSETNIEDEKNESINTSNIRSSSLPKKFNNSGDMIRNNINKREMAKRDISDILNRSEQISRDENEDNGGKKSLAKSENESLNYQKLLFDNGNSIKKQIQSKLYEEKNKKKGDFNALNKDPKLSFLNSAIGVGSLPKRNTNIIGGINNEKPQNYENNTNNPGLISNVNNHNNNAIDSKFNPSQNSHLMSNLINLNLQLNKLNMKKEKETEQSNMMNNLPNDHMININNFNITTNQVNNININLQKMMPIRATFEIKDPNNRSNYNQSINIDIDKPNSINNSFTNNKSPNNLIYSKFNPNNPNRVNNPTFQPRSISPMTKEILKESSNKQNSIVGKTRLRSSSPAQNHVYNNNNIIAIANNNNDDRYWGIQKPKWKF